MSDDDGTGRVKIDGAREALIDFVRSLQPSTAVGLRTYPGGTQEDDQGCSTGALQFPVAPPNLTGVDATIRSLTADGNTPTAAALTQAAEDLKDAHQTAATIVLVSDGLSNCGADPCDVAGQLSASGVDITILTVGFQVSPEGAAQLQCIASRTHGLYSDVSNTEQLVDELNRLSHSLLDVKLDYPKTVKAVVGSNGSGGVDIRATITVTGAQAVRDAQAAFTFTADNGPAVLSPRRRFGNLQPGESRTVTWTFRPPLEDKPRPLTFTATARGANSPPAVVNGNITLDPTYDKRDAGPILRNADRVAILGDSYSSGEGGGDYLAGTDTPRNGCHRSPHTYATGLYGDVRSPAHPDGQIDLIACSGATTHEIANPNTDNAGEGAQTALLAKSHDDAVIMTIGGNDAGFASVIERCAVLPHCDGSPDVVSLTPYKFFDDAVLARIDGLVPTLIDSIRDVDNSLNSSDNLTARNHPAPVIVLAYPSLGPGHFFALPSCSVFESSELEFFERMALHLNGSLLTAVNAVRDEGRPVYFVPDTEDSFQPDHNYCSSEPWLHTLSLAGGVSLLTKTVLDAPKQLLAFVPTLGSLLAAAAKQFENVTERAAAVRSYKEQMHPTVRGYQAITAELVRWSTSAAAKKPVNRAGDLSGTRIARADRPDATIRVDASRPSGTGTTDLQPGDTVQLQAQGLAPGSTVELYLRSAPSFLDRATVNDQGRVTFEEVLSPSLPIGSHTLELNGQRPNGAPVAFGADLHITRPRPWWVIPLALIGLLLAAAGATLWLLRRRERPGSPPRSPEPSENEVLGK